MGDNMVLFCVFQLLLQGETEDVALADQVVVGGLHIQQIKLLVDELFIWDGYSFVNKDLAEAFDPVDDLVGTVQLVQVDVRLAFDDRLELKLATKGVLLEDVGDVSIEAVEQVVAHTPSQQNNVNSDVEELDQCRPDHFPAPLVSFFHKDSVFTCRSKL